MPLQHLRPCSLLIKHVSLRHRKRCSNVKRMSLTPSRLAATIRTLRLDTLPSQFEDLAGPGRNARLRAWQHHGVALAVVVLARRAGLTGAFSLGGFREMPWRDSLERPTVLSLGIAPIMDYGLCNRLMHSYTSMCKKLVVRTCKALQALVGLPPKLLLDLEDHTQEVPDVAQHLDRGWTLQPAPRRALTYMATAYDMYTNQALACRILMCMRILISSRTSNMYMCIVCIPVISVRVADRPPHAREYRVCRIATGIMDCQFFACSE